MTDESLNLAALEKRLITMAIDRHYKEGNKTICAALGISESTFHRRLKHHGISRYGIISYKKINKSLWGGYSRVLTHKGNCTNPIHIYNKTK